MRRRKKYRLMQDSKNGPEEIKGHLNKGQYRFHVCMWLKMDFVYFKAFKKMGTIPQNQIDLPANFILSSAFLIEDHLASFSVFSLINLGEKNAEFLRKMWEFFM